MLGLGAPANPGALGLYYDVRWLDTWTQLSRFRGIYPSEMNEAVKNVSTGCSAMLDGKNKAAELPWAGGEVAFQLVGIE